MRDTDRWILDLTKFPKYEDASLFEGPFKIVQQVKIARDARSKGAATENKRLDNFGSPLLHVGSLSSSLPAIR